MNELETINNITTEILMLKSQTALNIIEIGKRLNQVKEELPHGEWENYLKNKVNFSQMTATRFMKVAKESPNLTSMLDLTTTKIFALLELPKEKREKFIEENPVADMTVKDLEKAIKEKNLAEQRVTSVEKANKALEEKLQKEIEKKSKVSVKEVVKEVAPSDYELIKKKLTLYEERDKLNQKEVKEYENLKKQMELLTKQKDSFTRKVNSAVELSGLVVKIDNFLKTQLAPIGYSRAVREQLDNEVVQANLKEICDIVDAWCKEMYGLLNGSNYVDVELNENE